jgi:hypothetical protein
MTSMVISPFAEKIGETEPPRIAPSRNPGSRPSVPEPKKELMPMYGSARNPERSAGAVAAGG